MSRISDQRIDALYSYTKIASMTGPIVLDTIPSEVLSLIEELRIARKALRDRIVASCDAEEVDSVYRASLRLAETRLENSCAIRKGE